MRYYADDELNEHIMRMDDSGSVSVTTLGRTIEVAAYNLADPPSWLMVEGDGDVITFCGRYRYRHVGMTVRSDPVYTLMADLEETP